MTTSKIAILMAATLILLVAFWTLALAADSDTESTSPAAAPPAAGETGAEQVQSGAKQVGEGVGETASGVGHTIVGGVNVATDAVVGVAKGTGRVVGRVGKNIGRGAKAVWETTRDHAVDFADDVVRFFKRPF
ncbi:MAG: hypothetical protein C5B48_09340 [Candidatus Rokuibacteriota bacterium]|nr:MAG: hypothetical protein C5B48_09340 [Candidatus Rokubacteria bacterium]